MIANAMRSVSTGETVVVVGALEPAVDANERRRAHLDVHVGRAAFDGVAQQLVEIQHGDDSLP